MNLFVDSVLDGLAKAKASRATDANTANDICSGGFLIDEITKKKKSL